MTDNALEVIRSRNDFYRHNYRRLILALVLNTVGMVVLFGALAYVVVRPPAPRYFAVSPDGRMTPLVALSEPNLSNAALLQWAVKATTLAFDYNFVNYRQALQGLRDNFTEDGWKSFATALNNSNNLSTVITKKLVVSAVPTGSAIILEQGAVGKTYTWKVQLPLLITYQSASEFISQPVTITLVITRISTLTSAQGIGIRQFIVSGSGSIRG